MEYMSSLARMAKPFRWVCLVLTVVVFLVTSNNLKSPEWSTLLTAGGALLGVYGAWLTLEIFGIGDTLSAEQQKIIKEVKATVLSGAKIQHVHELRRRFFDAKMRYEDTKTTLDERGLAFWEFTWRFETYNVMSINLEPNGFARIRVVGVNNPALEVNPEVLEYPIYTVDVLEVHDHQDLVPGRAFCKANYSGLRIGNRADQFEIQNPSVKFTIGGLGPIEGGRVGQRPKNFKRLKDLTDPLSNNQDQGI